MAIPKNTTVPKSAGKFMKLELGENNFRVLSDVRIGYEGWKDEKPFRHEGNECFITPDMVEINKLSKKPAINYFWVMAVWNYQTEQVQALEITQKTVMNPLLSLEENKKWGDIKNYDLTVYRKVEGDKTTFTTQPNPKEALTDEILQAYADSDILTVIDEMFDMQVPEKDFISPNMPAVPIIQVD